jgi:hypothetical protein
MTLDRARDYPMKLVPYATDLKSELYLYLNHKTIKNDIKFCKGQKIYACDMWAIGEFETERLATF